MGKESILYNPRISHYTTFRQKQKSKTESFIYWWYKGDKRIKLNGERHLNKSIHNISILKLSIAMTLK